MIECKFYSNTSLVYVGRSNDRKNKLRNNFDCFFLKMGLVLWSTLQISSQTRKKLKEKIWETDNVYGYEKCFSVLSILEHQNCITCVQTSANASNIRRDVQDMLLILIVWYCMNASLTLLSQHIHSLFIKRRRLDKNLSFLLSFFRPSYLPTSYLFPRYICPVTIILRIRISAVVPHITGRSLTKRCSNHVTLYLFATD